MDYNAEQAFWSTFSSNHPELNLPYVAMVHHVLPAAREWARTLGLKNVKEWEVFARTDARPTDH